MNRTMHTLTPDNSPIEIEISQDGVVFISGIEPTTEWTLKLSATDGQSEAIEFTGPVIRPRNPR